MIFLAPNLSQIEYFNGILQYFTANVIIHKLGALVFPQNLSMSHFSRLLMPLLLLISDVHVDCDDVKLLFRVISDDSCSHKYVLLNTAQIWQAN